MTETCKYVISILVADRPGIMRDVTTAIADMGANVDGISQTVVEGYFTVILTALFPEQKSEAEVTDAIAQHFKDDNASVSILPFTTPDQSSSLEDGEPYVLTMTGRDRPAIIRTAAACLADHGINIEDWQYEFADDKVTYMAEITVPPDLDIPAIRQTLKEALAEIGIHANMQHRNIFRATNEIGPIKSLLEQNNDP